MAMRTTPATCMVAPAPISAITAPPLSIPSDDPPVAATCCVAKAVRRSGPLVCSVISATPQPAATVETAVRLGRLLGYPVVLPRSLLRAYLSDGDREFPTSRLGGPRLSLVSLVPTAPHWKSALPLVRRELGLSVAPSLT